MCEFFYEVVLGTTELVLIIFSPMRSFKNITPVFLQAVRKWQIMNLIQAWVPPMRSQVCQPKMRHGKLNLQNYFKVNKLLLVILITISQILCQNIWILVNVNLQNLAKHFSNCKLTRISFLVEIRSIIMFVKKNTYIRLL